MSARKKERHVVRVFASNGSELVPTTPARARKLLEAGLAEVDSIMRDIGVFAIMLKTDTRKEAFDAIKDANKFQGENTICWGCETEVPVTEPGKRHWCSNCLEAYEKQRSEDMEIYLRARSRMMLDRALLILERQKDVEILYYKEASEVIEDKIKDKPNSFDSAHEMVTVMELLRKRVQVKLHPPAIGKHRVDLILPEDKIVLEIDGYMHKLNKNKDIVFNQEVLKELGEGWEIVRVPTEFIEGNIVNLVPVIRKKKAALSVKRFSVS
jgi:very-short-patch-repair endonuclease